jgi:hypothetical protein
MKAFFIFLLISFSGFGQNSNALISDLEGIMNFNLEKLNNYLVNDLKLELTNRKDTESNTTLVYNHSGESNELFNAMASFTVGFKSLVVLSFNQETNKLYESVNKELQNQSKYILIEENASQIKYSNGVYIIVLSVDVVIEKISYSVTIIRKS